MLDKVPHVTSVWTRLPDADTTSQPSTWTSLHANNSTKCPYPEQTAFKTFEYRPNQSDDSQFRCVGKVGFRLVSSRVHIYSSMLCNIMSLFFLIFRSGFRCSIIIPTVYLCFNIYIHIILIVTLGE